MQKSTKIILIFLEFKIEVFNAKKNVIIKTLKIKN